MSPECVLTRVLAGGHLVSGVLSLDELPLPVPAQPAGGPALHLAGEGHQLLARAGVGDVLSLVSMYAPVTSALWWLAAERG